MRKEPMTADTDELTDLPREETLEPQEVQVAPKPLVMQGAPATRPGASSDRDR